MEYLKRSDLTMDPSLQVTSLQSSQRTGALSTVHLHQGTPGAMDKQNLQSRLSKVCLPVPSALDRIHIHTGVPQLIHIYDHLPRCSINVLYAQLCHKGSAAECERLEEHATNHDYTGCHRKAPLYAGQSVSVINNDRTLAPCHCSMCS